MRDTPKSKSSDPSTEESQTVSRVSRRRFLGNSLCGAAVVGAGLSAVGPAVAQYGAGGGARSRKKEPQAVARYQDSPKGDQRCGLCTHFRPPGSCEIVEGQISDHGWCRHFKAKGGRAGTPSGRSGGSGRTY